LGVSPNLIKLGLVCIHVSFLSNQLIFLLPCGLEKILVSVFGKYIITFYLGFMMKVGATKKDIGWKNVTRFKCILTNVWNCIKSESLAFLNDNPLKVGIGVSKCFESLEQKYKWKILFKLIFYIIEKFWSVNIESGLAFSIWRFEVQVIVKSKVENKINNLICNH
jgi:hypothetical protein